MFFRSRLAGANKTRSLISFANTHALLTIRKGARPEISVERLNDAGEYPVDSTIPAWVILRSPKVFLKLAQTPVMPKGELLSSIRYTERDLAPFNLDSALADAWIMDGANASPKMNSLIAVLPETIFNEIADNGILRFGALKGINVVPSAIRALAINAASLRTPAPALYIHVCDEGFGAYALSGGKMVFMREMAIPKTADTNGFHKTLAEEIARSADFLARTTGISFERVWILGSEESDGLPEILSSQLGVDVNVYDPARDFTIRFSGSQSIAKSSLAIMLGAALDEGKTINISPRKPEPVRFTSKPALAFGLITAVALCFGIASNLVVKNMDSRIMELEARIGGMKKATSFYAKAAEELSRVETENAVLESRIEAFEKVLSSPRPGLHAALTLLATNSPENVAITRLQVDAPSAERRDATQAVGNAQSRRNTKIEGLAKGNEAEMTAGVSAFISSLSGSPLFSSVTLSRLRKETPGSAGSGMTSFEIVADLAPSERSGLN
ncbi:MAG: PilN domain-containing protein [Nitrospinae bacterium]|nr:PilN domain-containing protein [Nitrospinota bacterium]MBF0633100.1 PilN domain-containing protein [Nitrospinota bacterium]